MDILGPSLLATLEIAVVIGVFFLFLRLAIALMARKKFIFTFRVEGQFQYHIRGDEQGGELVEIVGRVKGFKINQATHKLEPLAANESDPQRTWIEAVFGAYYIGWWPNQILVYDFVWDRERYPSDPEDDKSGKFEVDDKYDSVVHRHDLTDFFAYKAVYAIVVSNVHTNEQIEVHVLGTITIRAFDLYTPVILLKGRWFFHVRSAVQGAINDFVQRLSLAEFREEDKISEGSELVTAIVQNTRDRLREHAGVEIEAFTFQKWRSSDADIEKAARAKAIAELEAAGVRATAQGKADAKRILGEGEAAAIMAVGTAEANAAQMYVNTTMGNSAAPRILGLREMRYGIAEHKGTLVLGGSESNGGTMLLLPPEGEPPPQGTPAPGNLPIPAAKLPTNPPKTGGRQPRPARPTT